MRANVLALPLLVTAATALTLPNREQAVLAGERDQAQPATTTTRIASLASMTASPAPAKQQAPLQSLWDWLFPPPPSNRHVKPEAKGCFCAGGSVCCYLATKELSCEYGTCGI